MTHKPRHFGGDRIERDTWNKMYALVNNSPVALLPSCFHRDEYVNMFCISIDAMSKMRLRNRANRPTVIYTNFD